MKPGAVEEKKALALTKAREREVRGEIWLANEEIQRREDCSEDSKIHSAVRHDASVICDRDAFRPVHMVSA